MQQVIYYVAVSLDGYIAGPNEDISMFAQSGEGVSQYLSDLQSFQTVIMGRKTYEFGYQFGLKPGQPVYPHMNHYIFSDSLFFEARHQKVQVCSADINFISKLKEESPTDIYLCGGGSFAGWMMENELIDIVKLKLNPIVLGGGIPLFNGIKSGKTLKLIDHRNYDSNFQIVTYQV